MTAGVPGSSRPPSGGLPVGCWAGARGNSCVSHRWLPTNCRFLLTRIVEKWCSSLAPGLLGDWNPSECERHHGWGQREQNRGEREIAGSGAQQLATDPAQWFGRTEQPLYPLHRVGGGRG